MTRTRFQADLISLLNQFTVKPDERYERTIAAVRPDDPRNIAIGSVIKRARIASAAIDASRGVCSSRATDSYRQKVFCEESYIFGVFFHSFRERYQF
jgi:hypothetical protein